MNASVAIRGVWEDDDLFEVEISGGNGAFFGTCRCYTIREEIKRFSEALTGFPSTSQDRRTFTTYGSNDFSYFSFEFFCTDSLGSAVARVLIADISKPSNARKQEQRVEFELPIEAAAVDAFCSELKQVATAGLKQVTATLYGRI